ncbi:MAG: CapA family protein [Oscillospiraceae bacterium]
MAKITIIGDIMCEPLLLKAAKHSDGTYHFDGVFEYMKSFFQESDYVIGNLETPLAGKEAGYTSELSSFNTPDAFADAIKNAGISYVSTANNHCMDRGFDGLLRTIKVLDDKALAHSGTFSDTNDGNYVPIVQVKGDTIAIIPFTYGVNYADHHYGLNDEEEKHIFLLHNHREPVYLKRHQKNSLPYRAFMRMLKPLKPMQRMKIKKMLGMTYNSPRTDDYLDETTACAYFSRLEKTVENAKKKADVVIFLPHVGGQFNLNPGKFSQYTFDKALSFGVDAIVASHPHIVQKAEIRQNVPCFYSIGNFSMSPNSVYLLHEHLPEYGLAVHLYIEEKRIQKTTFSILKIVEKKNQMLCVYPVTDYRSQMKDFASIQKLEREVRQIYKTVTGHDIEGDLIQTEYLLSENR